MKELLFYVVKKDQLYKTDRDTTFSNFYSAKLYKEKKKADQAAERFDAKVIPVLVKEVAE